MRIGFGYDVHPLKEGESFWLGGIKIDHAKGTVAHSDGDVLIHALCDAILGALSLRDIGYHFPDNDPTYKNADSKTLLSKTVELMQKHHYLIGNIDATICLQKPKLQTYIVKMMETLSGILNTETSNINIKATTTEKMGFVGREEGISAYAVVLLKPA